MTRLKVPAVVATDGALAGRRFEVATRLLVGRAART